MISIDQIPNGSVALYETKDGAVAIDVRLHEDTLWLSLNQLAALFDRDKSVISRHLRNVFKRGELEREAVVAVFATTAADGKTYRVEYFNLDAIISVGYRVNSVRGTQFRVWATGVLRDHLLRGYTINERRLEELKQSVRLIADTATRRDLSGDEARSLLAVVGEYTRALDLLDDYDHQRVRRLEALTPLTVELTYPEALAVVDHLRSRFAESSLFGVEKDDGLRSALGAVMQTAGGQDVYPSLEEKAAHLLYFLVKNHAFVDGNKRIAAAVFLWFLELNSALVHADGSARIAGPTLVAITLMIAESRPKEKDILVRIVMHLIGADESASMA